MKRLPVDLAELTALLDEARGGPVRSFLDRTSGELESMPREVEDEAVFGDILTAPERWMEIHPLPFAERRELRRRFVDQEVADPHLRLRLFEALEGPRPLGGFHGILRGHGSDLDRWFIFRARQLAPLARAWLSALDIEPVEGTPGRAASLS